MKGYPSLLLFRAADKKAGSTKSPKVYGDNGHSLHELFGYIVRESSFDALTLKVATSEQLGALLADEDALRLEYEALDRLSKRNEGRKVLENQVLDYLNGEVVFDGKRWHIVAAVALVSLSVVLVFMVLSRSLASSSKKGSQSQTKLL